MRDVSKAKRGDYIARIRQSLKTRAKRRYNELYWWFWEHYDEIGAGDKGAADRANWVAVADYLNAMPDGPRVRVGKNADGTPETGPIKPETARRTFARVKEDKAKGGVANDQKQLGDRGGNDRGSVIPVRGGNPVSVPSPVRMVPTKQKE